MSYNTSALPIYVEQNRFPLLTKSILGAKTATLVTKQNGVKGQASLNILDEDCVFIPGGCGFTASGSSTLSQRTITTGYFQVNKKWCPSDLDNTYAQTQLQPGSYIDQIPFEQTFSELQSKYVARELEIALWQGDKTSATNNLSFFDGYLKVISGSGAQPVSTGGYVTGSYHLSSSTDSTVYSGSNIANVLQGVYNAIPNQIKDAEDLVIFVGRDTLTAYQNYLFNANLFHYAAESTNGEIKLFPYGTRLIAVNGLNGVAKVPIVAGRLSNFFYGLDLEDDLVNYEMFWAQEAQEMRFILRTKAGVQIAFPQEITYWYNGQ